MTPEVIGGLVRFVSDARRLRAADDVIIERLVDMGVPKEHAADLLKEITTGLQHGAQVAYLGFGEYPTSPPASPLHVAAFKEGQHAYRVEMRMGAWGKFLLFVVVAVLCTLGYYFSR